MIFHDIKNDLQAVLLSIGWHPGRQFDVSEWITELRGRGFHILENGVAILKELGNLQYSNDDDSTGLPVVEVMFDPRLAMVRDLRYWEQSTELRMFPIGEVDGRAALMVDEHNRWYESMGGLWKIGDSAEEGLEMMFFGKGETETVCRPR